MTKPRLTFDEHVELGRTLAEIRDELQRRYIQIANAYPQSGLEGRAGKRLEASLQALEQARSALDNALAMEHPEEFAPSVYYPPTESRVRFGRR